MIMIWMKYELQEQLKCKRFVKVFLKVRIDVV